MKALYIGFTAIWISSTVFANGIKVNMERTYSHHLFQTQKDCEDAQKGGHWFNCHQVISLHPDGSASVMLTDIMNPASYSIDGDKVVIRRKGDGDMPAEMKLRMDHTGRNLVSTEENLVWELEMESNCQGRQ
jgi:hypothetical protein